jgi:hypothetical protein
MTATLLVQAAQPTAALSCVPQGTLAEAESAAIAALKGQRSFGATSFVIGEIVGVDRSGEFPRLEIQASHIFVADQPSRFDVYIRPDGPPSVEELREGTAYFLALHSTRVDDLPALLLAACAPIFPITSPAQLQRILDAADYSEAVGALPMRHNPANTPPLTWPIPALVAIGATGAAVAVAVAVRKARPKARR